MNWEDKQDWLNEWATLIYKAFQTTRHDELIGNARHCWSGFMSLRVIPDSYQTGSDGRDWCDVGQTFPTIHVTDHETSVYSLKQIRVALQEAVDKLDELPASMGGFRHGEVVVSVRKGKRVKGDVVPGELVLEVKPANVSSRGLKLRQASVSITE